MKVFLWGIFICLGTLTTAQAQITQNATRQLRIYEDDDFFNVWGRGTDRGYSNGTAIGYVYMKKKKSTFLDKWIFPKAGPSSINVFEWQLMQVMITPNQIADTSFDPADFYYAGALFATHGLTSYNPVKKYSFHSELVFGVLGPWAGAEQTQRLFHRLIHYQEPEGWGNQVPNAPLLNYNFSFEAMLWNPLKSLETTGEMGIHAGTMMTSVGASLYGRYGLINPYFGGLDTGDATRRKFQLYVFARPQFAINLFNALLQGGIFRSTDTNFEELTNQQTSHMRRFTIGMDYGVGIGIGRTTIRYTQQTATAWMSGTGKHSVGNITLLIPLSKATYFPQ